MTSERLRAILSSPIAQTLEGAALVSLLARAAERSVLEPTLTGNAVRCAYCFERWPETPSPSSPVPVGDTSWHLPDCVAPLLLTLKERSR